MHSTVPGRCQSLQASFLDPLWQYLSTSVPSVSPSLRPGMLCIKVVTPSSFPSAGNLSIRCAAQRGGASPTGEQVEVRVQSGGAEAPGWPRARTHQAVSCSLPWCPTHHCTDTVHTLSLSSLRAFTSGTKGLHSHRPGPTQHPLGQSDRPPGAGELGNWWPPGPQKGQPTNTLLLAG